MKPVGLPVALDTGALEKRRSVEIRDAAEAFEAMFLQTLIKKMRESQLEQGLFGKSAGSSVYEGMFDQMLGDQLSEGSPLGIADQLEAQWAGTGQGHEKALKALREMADSAAKESSFAADE